MSLNTRLLFALLGFPLLVYALMSVLLVIQSDTKARAVQQERLESAGELLAPSFADAITEGDAQRLEILARQLLSMRGLRTVALFNPQGERLLLLGKSAPTTLDAPAASQLIMEEEAWRLRLPLGVTQLNTSPVRAGDGSAGWLDIEMGTRTLTLERYKLIASLSLGGMLLGLLMFLVAFRY